MPFPGGLPGRPLADEDEEDEEASQHVQDADDAEDHLFKIFVGTNEDGALLYEKSYDEVA